MNNLKTRRTYSIKKNNKSIHDEGLHDPVLQKYCEHLKSLFLKKLEHLNVSTEADEATKKRLKSLFEELLRIKDLISGQE